MAAVLCVGSASASCAGLAFCAMPPDRSAGDTVLFRGRVKQVTAPPDAPATRAGGRGPAPGPGEGRRRAGEALPTTEIRYPTAKFEILESFLGPPAGEFEVRLSSDLFLDGTPQDVPAFHEGEMWLVEAHKDPRDQQWTTSRCERNKPVVEAEEELQFLRAWALGQRIPASIGGQVWNPVARKGLRGVQVSLRGPTQTLSAVTNEDGQYLFSNLDQGEYEVVAALPENGGPIKVDLTRAWCRAVLFAVK